MKEEEREYTCIRTVGGTILLTEMYIVEYDDETTCIAVNPIEVISLGYNENEDGVICESLFYKKYIRFTDANECPIPGMNVEYVVPLAPDVIEMYKKYVPEFYGTVKKEEIPEEVKNQVNVIIGKFNTKKPH